MAFPHLLTLLRVLLSPIIMLVYLKYEWLGLTILTMPYLLLFLLIVCELTDALDGYFARKWSCVSDLGKLIDPMADSVYRITVFLTFTRPPVSLPIILVFLFLYRDAFVSTLRTICALKGVALAARPSGKVKAILQAITIFLIVLLLIPFSMGMLSENTLFWVSTLSVGLVALYAAISGIDYIWSHRASIQRLL